uniref:DUF4135 domain-containing protein n=1 Tax=Heterorhabditis bacteriophora TaxID=37862 RepID=A0A1I7WJI5_HETBA
MLYLLRCIFYITDLHSDNFGLDKDDRVVIIDFQYDLIFEIFVDKKIIF